MTWPDVDYSLAPTTQQQMLSWGRVPQVQVPQMLDYSFGMQGNQGLQIPNYTSIAGFGSGQGLQMGGGQGLKFGDYRATDGTPQGIGSGFGWNMPTFALGLQGLNSLGSLYMGAKSLSLANKQFESAQKFANTNLANQTHNYNDLARRRVERSGMGTGASREEMDAEIARRKLPSQV